MSADLMFRGRYITVPAVSQCGAREICHADKFLGILAVLWLRGEQTVCWLRAEVPVCVLNSLRITLSSPTNVHIGRK
jgi:hypothetical protein